MKAAEGEDLLYEAGEALRSVWVDHSPQNLRGTNAGSTDRNTPGKKSHTSPYELIGHIAG